MTHLLELFQVKEVPLASIATRLERIEVAVKYMHSGGEATALPKARMGKGLEGFRAGSTATPQAAADDGAEDFAQAEQEYGARPDRDRTRQGGCRRHCRNYRRTGSARMHGDGDDVLGELDALTGQVKAIEEKVVCGLRWRWAFGPPVSGGLQPRVSAAGYGASLQAGGCMASTAPP
ncbi:hypothetical protein CYMTET_49122 [Cymbomonas tetramitiformis]|uniref:Uncharacterized protein n=1 Tax=Cymbomonas tetramitiformis TaxID=36881 RepID=A0AAE0BRY6_9CHLO|nr:hypothetical protein CYMTET_49122 [Cymbomonas tetramitiformis]